jgi:uroporphyrinogen-III synthase
LADINIAITKEEIKESDIPQFNNQNKFKEKIKIIPIPTILTVPIYSKEISNSLKKIEKNYYDYYIFASAHSVNIFFKTIKNEKNAENILEKIKKSNENNNNNFIAIGPKTKKEIEKNNIKAKLAISFASNINDDDNNNNNNFITHKEKKIIDYSTSSIMQFLDHLDKIKTNKKINILMPRSAESIKSNNFISKVYENLDLEQVFFYKTIEFNRIRESEEWIKFKELVFNKKLPCLIFTSPSTVRSFFNIILNDFYTRDEIEQNKYQIQISSNVKKEQELLNVLGFKLIISIGPKTSEELKKRNIKYKESEEHTIKGTLNHLLKYMSDIL